MKLAFAGTPEFAKTALEHILAAGHSVALVLTQPDRPAGRGLKMQASAVKTLAQQWGIAVAQPRSLRLDGKYPLDAQAAQAALQAADIDAMAVAAYGLILPQWVLDLPPLGCFNIHASLLPRWRGAAPIHRAIEAGDAETGITIMQMDAGLDTGDMLLVEKMAIADNDSSASLHDKLADCGGRLIVQALQLAEQRQLRRTPQPRNGVSYAQKIEKAEAAIDWSQPAAAIQRKIRALNPAPGASTLWQGQGLKLFCSEIASELSMVGKDFGAILSVNTDGIVVQCGQGQLRLTELQRAGGKRLAVADFVRGNAGLVAGERLGGTV